MATNCIGPILLTDLLIDNLKQTARVKVQYNLWCANALASVIASIKKLVLKTQEPDFKIIH